MTEKIFLTMSWNEILQKTKNYPSRGSFLRAHGIPRNSSRLLNKLMQENNVTLDDLWPNRRSKILTHSKCLEHYDLDLKNEIFAYLFGFLTSDGNLSIETKRPNKGSVSIQLNEKDEDILYSLKDNIPWKSSIRKRSRITNFGCLNSADWKCSSYDLRKQLLESGFVAGKKSLTCAPPTCEYNEIAFWRGMIDGDGSLGLIKKGLPFISLVSSSKNMAEAYFDFLEKTIGYRPKVNPNRRDGVWNIGVYKEDSQLLVNILYPGKIFMKRKYEKAQDVLSWIRPESMKKLNKPGKWVILNENYETLEIFNTSREAASFITNQTGINTGKNNVALNRRLGYAITKPNNKKFYISYDHDLESFINRKQGKLVLY